MNMDSFSKCLTLFPNIEVIAVCLCFGMSLPVAAQTVDRAAEVPALTEGPTVDQDGTLYFTELRSERIFKLSTDGELTCEGGGDGIPARITRTNLRSGAIDVLADNYQGVPFNGTNDVTIDGQGRVYFTDPGAGAVYRIDQSGEVTRVLTAPDISRPNGLQISPDDATLYIIEAGAVPDGDRMIRSFDLDGEGTASNGRVLFDFPGRSADGMSIDIQGNLYVSAGLNELAPPGALTAARVWTEEALMTRAGVYVISPRGTLLNFIPIPEDVITNNAFGGQDMKTLYVTAGRTVFQVQTEIAGLPR
jgi:gluconolactonase